jgi:hypothetical protein
MAKSDCPGCRLPFYFRFIVKWGDNGTIGMGPNPSQRLVLVESELLNDIYRRIEAVVAVSIRHIVFEAERAAAKATIDVMMPKSARWLVNNRLIMHPASRGLQHIARLAGMADARTIFYHVYRGSLASIRNPMNLDIFGAMVVGAFESTEGVIYDYEWVDVDDTLYLLVMPAESKPEIAARLVPEVGPPLPGNRRLDLCRRCSLPRALQHLNWDVPNAVITDTRRGVRMSLIDGYAFSTVFRELIAELGSDIVPIIIEASREYTHRSIEETGFLGRPESPLTTYEEYLDLLPIYGHGNPVESEINDDLLRVTIENPYSVHMLAGQLLAIFEAVQGTRGSVSFDKFATQRVRITVSPCT